MLTSLFIKVLSKFNTLRKLIWRHAYQLLARQVKDPSWTFMNYGWIGEQIPTLSSRDEVNRHFIQLYDRVTKDVIFEDKELLEIGCGRGGGAEWLARTKNLQSVTACDLSSHVIDFCSHVHHDSSVHFCVDDAEALSFKENSFDIVISIECSHCFASISDFATEVNRVLKPGGIFCWADMWASDRVSSMLEQLDSTELSLLDHTDLTAGVVAALDAEEENKQILLQRTSWWIRPLLRKFAGTKQSTIYRAISQGDIGYQMRVYQKPSNEYENKTVKQI